MVNILGINISDLKKPEVLAKIKGWFNAPGQHYIVTPNPEIILKAAHEHDEELFYILNQADLAIADGVGLKFAAWMQNQNLPRITGADLVQDILALAQENKLKVLIINWDEGLSKKTDIAAALNRHYPQLDFMIRDEARDFIVSDDETDIKTYGAKILLNTFGSPYQEKFVYHNLKYLPSIKVAISVGGALDFLTKKIKRAPKIMRTVGLEWLWRLGKQPQRLGRIYNATWIFMKENFKSRFIWPWIYRKNVACLVYRNDEGHYKILIVERADHPGHWQLPQGGTDGLDPKTAAIKEIGEELGLTPNKLKVKAIVKDLYKYKFDPGLGKQNFPSQRHTGYKGQSQSLAIVEFLGNENEPQISFWDHLNYKWVASNNLINEVHELRKPSAKIFLEKFKELI